MAPCGSPNINVQALLVLLWAARTVCYGAWYAQYMMYAHNRQTGSSQPIDVPPATVRSKTRSKSHAGDVTAAAYLSLNKYVEGLNV